MYPLPTRAAGLGSGTTTEILLRASASWKDCCTAGVAPSPTWQHGEMTMKLSLGLATPSLAAVKLAAPPPVALTVALLPTAEIETTRLLVVAQDTGRSV